MSAIKILQPLNVFGDTDGDPIDDGFLNIGVAGLDPLTNPVNVYFDEGLTALATQPIRTRGGRPLNAGAAASLYTAAGDYSLLLRNKNSSTVVSRLSGNVGLTPDGTVATTVALIAGRFPAAATGAIITTQGYASAGDGGGARWKKTGATGLTASQSPAQRAVAKLNDANGHEWALLSGDTVGVRSCGAVGDGAADDSAALLAAFGAILAGDFKTIFFESGQYSVTASLVYLFDIQNISGFAIKGAGRESTEILFPGDTDAGILRVQSCTDFSISGITINQAATTTSGFHGLAITDCQNFRINATTVKNTRGYGIGLQGDATASYENCSIDDVWIFRSGADGIDFKNNEGANKAIRLSNLYIEDPSNLDTLKPALDLRGPCVVSNVAIVFKGTGPTQPVGVRTRQTGSGLIGAEDSSITNVIVLDARVTPDVSVGFAPVEVNSNFTNCTAHGVGIGFQVGVEAEGTRLLNCLARECSSFGYIISAPDTKVIGCKARDGLSEGFRSSSTTRTQYAFCESINNATYGFRAAAATDLELAYCTASGNTTADYAVGSTARTFQCENFVGNVDLDFNGLQTVKFGTRTAIGAETVTGYISIVDSTGVARKLAVVS